MKILVSEKLSPHKFKTPEGYLICTDAILARTGKQTYKRGEIFGNDCRDSEADVEVDRRPEEVFSEKTMASFENKPVCVEHPDCDINVHNHNEYAVGFVRDVHKGNIDGQDVVLGTLVITDAKTIDEIENGEHTDLSCGYDCDIEDSDHPEQKNIRGNHVALCQQGRAGIARIVDSDVPRGYKVTGNNYAWELAGTAKDKKEAANKFVRKYPELENIWGISELLNFMIRSNKDVERDTELGYALHFDYDEYTKKFYIAFVEKKYRYDDSIKDDQNDVYEIGFVDRSTDRSRYVEITASSAEEAIRKVKKMYDAYRIFQVRKLPTKNSDNNKKILKSSDRYFEDKKTTYEEGTEMLENEEKKFRSLDSVLRYIRKLRDDRLSPMTYRKLNELGVRPQQWKNWTQEQANNFIASRTQAGTTQRGSAQERKEEPSLKKAQNKRLASTIMKKFASRLAKYNADIWADKDGLFLQEISADKRLTYDIIDYIRSKGLECKYTPDDAFCRISQPSDKSAKTTTGKTAENKAQGKTVSTKSEEWWQSQEKQLDTYIDNERELRKRLTNLPIWDLHFLATDTYGPITKSKDELLQDVGDKLMKMSVDERKKVFEKEKRMAGIMNDYTEKTQKK